MRAVIPWARLVIPLAVLSVGLDASPSPGQSAPDPRSESLPDDAPQPVYSADPADPWNRIFHALFTRPVRARLTEDFAGAGFFERIPDVMGFPELDLSTRTFARIEGGDRAIEPLYSASSVRPTTSTRAPSPRARCGARTSGP